MTKSGLHSFVVEKNELSKGEEDGSLNGNSRIWQLNERKFKNGKWLDKTIKNKIEK